MQNKIYMKKNLPQRNYRLNYIKLTIYEFEIKAVMIKFGKKRRLLPYQ